MLGRKAILPLLPSPVPGNPAENQTTEEWRTFLNEKIPIIHGKAIENIIQQAQWYHQKQYNKHSNSNPVKFNKDDEQVLLRNKGLLGYPKERWTGPWTIMEATNPQGTAYKISKASNPNTTSTANVYDLKPFIRRDDDVTISPPTQGHTPGL